MLSAYDEHTKSELLEKWNSEESDEQANLSSYLLEVVDEICNKIKIPKDYESVVKGKITNFCNKYYFYSNKRPKLDSIAEDGIDYECNTDDCSLSEVFRMVVIINFLKDSDRFIPESLDIEIPADYDDFKNLK